MRPSSMIFPFLASLAISAQAQAGASHPLFVRPPASQACPVRFSANREPGGPLHSTGSGETTLSQGIQVNFTNSANGVIVKADISVHGVTMAGREGLLLTGPTSISRNSTESYQVVGTADAPLLHRLIWTREMTAINWLELTRLEYDDGRVWQPSAESRCVAAPSLYVLVDSASTHH